jgi:hypothetical protein
MVGPSRNSPTPGGHLSKGTLPKGPNHSCKSTPDGYKARFLYSRPWVTVDSMVRWIRSEPELGPRTDARVATEHNIRLFLAYCLLPTKTLRVDASVTWAVLNGDANIEAKHKGVQRLR